MATDMNERTNLPHRVSLGDVLGAIEMSPGEVSAFLTDLSDRFRDSAHPNLARNFADHAALVSNPQTYGYRPPEGPQDAQERPYEPPRADTVGYGRDAQKGSPDASASMPQSAPAAQGQSTTPATVSSSAATPSQEQYATRQIGSEPTPTPTPSVAPEDFDSSASIGLVPPPPTRPRHFDQQSNTWRYNDDNSEVSQAEMNATQQTAP